MQIATQNLCMNDVFIRSVVWFLLFCCKATPINRNNNIAPAQKTYHLGKMYLSVKALETANVLPMPVRIMIVVNMAFLKVV